MGKKVALKLNVGKEQLMVHYNPSIWILPRGGVKSSLGGLGFDLQIDRVLYIKGLPYKLFFVRQLRISVGKVMNL